jgi:hypothetical protein
MYVVMCRCEDLELGVGAKNWPSLAQVWSNLLLKIQNPFIRPRRPSFMPRKLKFWQKTTYEK